MQNLLKTLKNPELYLQSSLVFINKQPESFQAIWLPNRFLALQYTQYIVIGNPIPIIFQNLRFLWQALSIFWTTQIHSEEMI